MIRFCAGLALTLTLVACQGFPGIGQPQSLDNSGFMRLWATYSDCSTTSDLNVLQGYEQQLARNVAGSTLVAEALFSLPTAVQRLVTEPSPRLAVDPTAMVASCTLHTGREALAKGRYDLAVEMFRTVIDRHPQAEYAYYVSQAREGLASVSLAAAVPAGSPTN